MCSTPNHVADGQQQLTCVFMCSTRGLANMSLSVRLRPPVS